MTHRYGMTGCTTPLLLAGVALTSTFCGQSAGYNGEGINDDAGVDADGTCPYEEGTFRVIFGDRCCDNPPCSTVLGTVGDAGIVVGTDYGSLLCSWSESPCADASGVGLALQCGPDWYGATVLAGDPPTVSLQCPLEAGAPPRDASHE